jgi:hypothetical protein
MSASAPRRSVVADSAAIAVVGAIAVAIGIGTATMVRPLILAVAVLVSASLTWFSPRLMARAALAMLFITPFLAVTPQLSPDQVNYSALYVVAVLPVSVVICATARRLTIDLGAALLVAALLSALITLLSNAVLVTQYQYMLWPLTTLAVYLLVLNSVDDLHRWLLGAICAFSLVEAFLGISQSFLGRPVFSLAAPVLFKTNRGLLGYVLPGFSNVVGNGSGTFQHFNGLGSTLALALPISLGWLLGNPRDVRRLLLFAILFMGLVASYSRGGLIAGILGCMYVYWTSRPRSSRSLIPLVVAGAFVLGAVLAPSVAAYYDATQNVSSRVATWRFALAYWLDHPEKVPFGLGFGFLQQTVLAQLASTRGTTLATLHSSLLQVLVEFGIVGLVVFGWFFIATARPFLFSRPNGWQVWVLGGMLAFLISQIADNSLFGMGGTCVFALAACLRRRDTRYSG